MQDAPTTDAPIVPQQGHEGSLAKEQDLLFGRKRKLLRNCELISTAITAAGAFVSLSGETRNASGHLTTPGIVAACLLFFGTALHLYLHFAKRDVDEARQLAELRENLAEQRALHRQLNRLLVPIEDFKLQLWFEIPLDQEGMESVRRHLDTLAHNNSPVMQVDLRAITPRPERVLEAIYRMSAWVGISTDREYVPNPGVSQEVDFVLEGKMGPGLGGPKFDQMFILTFDRHSRVLHGITPDVPTLAARRIVTRVDSMIDLQNTTAVIRLNQAVDAGTEIKMNVESIILRSKSGVLLMAEHLEKTNPPLSMSYGPLTIHWQRDLTST